MALASTPVDAELARPFGSSLIQSAGTIVDGSDYETPAILNPEYDGTAERPGAERGRRVRWIDGYTFYPDDCDGGHIVDPCQLGTSADSATETTPATLVGPIQPFIIEATDVCSTFGAPEPYRLARAQRKLLAVQSKVLEAEFWSGTKAQSQTWTNNQYLTAAGYTALPSGVGGALGIVDGLAALEQAVADGSAWARGFIHATPRLVTHWISQQLVEAVPTPGAGATLMTKLGTIVIAGRGYPGTGALGVYHSTHYQVAFVTPRPHIRLGEITYNDTDNDVVAVDRSTNDRRIRAARFASVAFSPCFRAAVLVNLTTALGVPGS